MGKYSCICMYIRTYEKYTICVKINWDEQRSKFIHNKNGGVDGIDPPRVHRATPKSHPFCTYADYLANNSHMTDYWLFRHFGRDALLM